MSGNSIDIGSVHIHKKVIADIIYAVARDVEGLKLVSSSWYDKVLQFLGKENYPGIKIKVDDKQAVSLTVKIVIFKGVNISDIARQLQDSIKESIEETVSVTIKVINVNIQGVEGGIK